MTALTEKTKILYIGGYNRSGSTLLLRLLSAVEGYHSVGELWILDNALQKNPLCGCGALFDACEFWVPVIDRAFGGFKNVDANRLMWLRKSILEGTGLLPLMFPPLRSSDFASHLSEYRDLLTALYEAIGTVSGGQVVVDSSKSAAYAFVLAGLPTIHLNVIHLVRDSRAIAYSWQRTKVRPEYHWGTEYMERYGPLRTAMAYCRPNLLLPIVQLLGPRYMRMRYEDLARNPQGELHRVGQLMREPSEKFDIMSSDNNFALSVDHTVAGNPMRFQKGSLVVSPDDEWQARMDPLDKYLVTAITWPLLLAYGYLRRGAAQTSAR